MPGRDAMLQVLERLEGAYGVAEWKSGRDPVEELVLCILSQNTNDSNSYLAFDRLMDAYGSWDDVVSGGRERLAEVVRCAGLGPQKAASIIASLERIKSEMGSYSLEHLRPMAAAEAREWLMRLPGVGPKTATIVLSFALGADVVAVDTHVFRVSTRAGLIPRGTSVLAAHDSFLEHAPPGTAFRLHMALIAHGRGACKARRPLCRDCVLADLCPREGVV